MSTLAARGCQTAADCAQASREIGHNEHVFLVYALGPMAAVLLVAALALWWLTR